MTTHLSAPGRLLALALLAGAPPAALAQQPPDAGRLLQEQQPPLAPPPVRELDLEAPVTAPAAPGGPTVTLERIEISGNSAFSEEELLALLEDAVGHAHDLAGLERLAARLTAHYRAHGYAFARAFVPAQRMSQGRLRLEVVEGRYGEVRAESGSPETATAAQAYLQALQPGELIRSRELERAALLLSDLPGVSITPVLRPGEAAGTGDLVVEVERERLLSGLLSLDNHGNRYSGARRAGAQLALASPLMLGDELSINGLFSDEGLWSGGLAYSLPIGASGLRARAGYAHTYYELGEEFAALEANGKARIAYLGLSYPLLRSQSANLTAAVSYQYKALKDAYDAVNISEEKHSHSVPISLQFDLRDDFVGGGLSFGALTWTSGELHLERDMRPLDRATLRSHGSFDKVNLELVRLQRLPAGFGLYARVAGQWAAGNDNLDSSESFGLGGADGVRAYPAGEAFGDEGVLGQLELRYAVAGYSPYLFYDHGKIRVNADPGPTVEARSEERSGAGLGLRWQRGGWRLDTSLAWRLSGGAPESDSRDRRPRWWASLGYAF